jgi:hypothetical protein
MLVSVRSNGRAVGRLSSQELGDAWSGDGRGAADQGGVSAAVGCGCLFSRPISLQVTELMPLASLCRWILASTASIADAEAQSSVQDGCFNTVGSTGSFLRRLPVAAKIALVTAGTMAEVPASPIPPGGSGLLMRGIW